jgi:protein gp37
MAKAYPNGWEPSLCSNRLGAPKVTKVPEDAATDTRFRNVFTCSMADLFGRWVPAEWIEAVLTSVRSSPEWNFLFLTKFPQRLAELEIPDNAWMGTTVDMQARVANAEKAFAKVGGKVKWLSVEPMIEPLRFERLDLFDWVVIGGASPTAADGESPQTPEWQPPYRWIDSLVRQCDDAKVPVYMKSNLGIANRVLQLPFDAPIKADPQVAPEAFSYLGKARHD